MTAFRPNLGIPQINYKLSLHCFDSNILFIRFHRFGIAEYCYLYGLFLIAELLGRYF